MITKSSGWFPIGNKYSASTVFVLVFIFAKTPEVSLTTFQLASYSVYPPVKTHTLPSISTTAECGLSPIFKVVSTTSVEVFITVTVLSSPQPPTLHT